MLRGVHKIIILSLTAALVCHAGCMFQPLINAERYHNEQYGFSIRLPSDWEQAPDVGGTAILARAPYDIETDLFQENVNVTVGAAPGNLNLDIDFHNIVSGISRTFLNYQQRATGTTTIAAKKAYWVEYTYQYGKLRLRTIFYLFATDEYMFMITCTGEEDHFSKYKRTFQSIAKSFRFE